MHRRTLLTADAEGDFKALVESIAKFDSPVNALRVRERLGEVTNSLAKSAKRGSIPKELRSVGMQEYRPHSRIVQRPADPVARENRRVAAAASRNHGAPAALGQGREPTLVQR